MRTCPTRVIVSFVVLAAASLVAACSSSAPESTGAGAGAWYGSGSGSNDGCDVPPYDSSGEAPHYCCTDDRCGRGEICVSGYDATYDRTMGTCQPDPDAIPGCLYDTDCNDPFLKCDISYLSYWRSIADGTCIAK